MELNSHEPFSSDRKAEKYSTSYCDKIIFLLILHNIFTTLIREAWIVILNRQDS